jgi:hypothetical protein
VKNALRFSVAVSVLAACDKAPTIVSARDGVGPAVLVAGEDGPSANGHGNLPVGDGELRTFSFHARLKKDGTVEGSVQLYNRALDSRIHADIDCLRFISPNRAIMSGPIRHSTNPVFVVGTHGFFIVTDNGEGAGDPEDTISNYFGPVRPQGCEIPFNLVERPIEGGNIQLKP